MAILDVESGFWSIRRQVEALIGTQLSNSVLQQAGANGGASFATSFGRMEESPGQELLFASCLQAYQAAGFGQFEISYAQWPIGRVTVRGRNAFEAWVTCQHGIQTEGPVCAYTAGVLVGFVNAVSARRDVVCIEHKCQAAGDEFCEFELLPISDTNHGSIVAFTPDLTLGRKLNLLEMLFERMPMGIAVIDRDYRLVRTNPTWAAFIDRYTPSKTNQVVPGARIFDLEPGAEEVLIPLFERVFAGETVRQDAIRIETGGLASFWDIVLSPLYEGERVVGLLNVSIDATGRVTAQRNLEQRVDERTRELSTLLDISHSLASTLDLEPLLDLILDQLKSVVAYDAASIMIFEHDILKILAYRGPIQREEALQIKFSIHTARANYQVIRGREPVIIKDIRGEGPLASAIRETAGDELETTYSYLRCWMGVPLIVKDQVVGMLTLDHQQPGYYASSQAKLAMAFANQAAVAIENARLYEQAEHAAAAQERNRLARDLHDAVSQTLFSATLIADVLPRLWDRNPTFARQKLEELRVLTKGALSEMRTLLLELRPATLVDSDLGDLVRHLTNAFTGRTRVPADLILDGLLDPPPAVKEVFYRVAQEALNNISKHAQASLVSVRLQRAEEQAQLEVRDDGCGFDPQEISTESLGLSIMYERVETIGAQLEIHTQLGAGTYIVLTWKDMQE